MTQGSAGSNATVNVTVKPILQGSSSVSGGEFESASVTFSHEQYQKAGITVYTLGAQSTKDPGYYQVQAISRDIYYKAENGSTKITIGTQSVSHSGDLFMTVSSWSYKVSKPTISDSHAATITDFTRSRTISGTSNNAGSN